MTSEVAPPPVFVPRSGEVSAARRAATVPKATSTTGELAVEVGAKPGDVFAHATDHGNYLNPEMWYDVVIYKGIWDPATSDPKLVGWSRDTIPKGWLVFHWHAESPGNGGMFYQAGAYRYGIALTTQDPEGDDGRWSGCSGVGIALPLEDCWGLRTLKEFGLEDEEVEKYTRLHVSSQAACSEQDKERIDYLKGLTMEKNMEDSGIIVRKKQKAAEETAEPANSVSE